MEFESKILTLSRPAFLLNVFAAKIDLFLKRQSLFTSFGISRTSRDEIDHMCISNYLVIDIVFLCNGVAMYLMQYNRNKSIKKSLNRT